MKKYFIFLVFGMFFSQAGTAQKVKKAEKDSVKAGRANDRLKNAGPKDGWWEKNDSAKKLKAQPADTARRKGSGNR